MVTIKIKLPQKQYYILWMLPFCIWIAAFFDIGYIDVVYGITKFLIFVFGPRKKLYDIEKERNLNFAEFNFLVDTQNQEVKIREIFFRKNIFP